jgi:hypothetical protein
MPAGATTPYESSYDYAGQDPINGYDLSGNCGLVGCLKWVGLQLAAVGGSASYSVYFANRAAYHALNYVPSPVFVQPLLGLTERAGLKGDMEFDKLEAKLGDPRGQYDEGKQDTGTVPVTHLGPKLNLPGAHQNGKKDLDPIFPKGLSWLKKIGW